MAQASLLLTPHVASKTMVQGNSHRSLCAVGGPLFVFVLFASACAGFPDGAPTTTVVLDNEYPAAASAPLVVYEAFWLNVTFPTPVAPGVSSARESTIPASANVAYVLLAPGWNPVGASPPTNFVPMQSRTGFGTSVGDTLHIPVDDATFKGNCAAGSQLTQSEADFLTQIVFSSYFIGARYDAGTCTTTPDGDAGAP